MIHGGTAGPTQVLLIRTKLRDITRRKVAFSLVILTLDVEPVFFFSLYNSIIQISHE